MSDPCDFTNVLTTGGHLALLRSVGMTPTQARAFGALFLAAADFAEEAQARADAADTDAGPSTALTVAPTFDDSHDHEFHVYNDDFNDDYSNQVYQLGW
ncbi:hypothetical protein ONZ45_g13090 [Pleurotus djamor]|nr:hypothetical protein ONZ45_g13090 [Pleurotus djamor]